MELFVLFLLLIICVVILYALLNSKTALTAVVNVAGGAKPKQKPVLIVDGLNYIHKQILKRHGVCDTYPSDITTYLAAESLRKAYPGYEIWLVMKNRDGYRMSSALGKFYTQIAKKFRIQIHLAYDPRPACEYLAHHYKGRDDKLYHKLIDKCKKHTHPRLLSEDKFTDRNLHDEIPNFKYIIFD